MTKSILLSRAVARASALLGACLLALACPAGAAAFTPAPSTPKAGGENTPLNLNTSTTSAHASSSGGASIVRTIVGLAIVIAVIWGLSWILRQVKAGRDPHVSSTGLTSVAALTLGAGRSVHLVRAGSDYVLLGATEHGVAPIHRYTEEQARDAGLFDDESILVQPAERSRLAAASQLVAGAGRVAASRMTGQGGSADLGAFAGPGRISDHDSGRIPDHSPVVGPRPDPMRAPSPSSGLIERLRELTVRR
jgi:flagellar protein FliO/FliZ